MKSFDWFRVFPDSDFRFRMGVRSGDLAGFFTEEDGFIDRMRLRRQVLDASPERHADAMPSAVEAVREAASEMLGPPWAADPAPAAGLCAELGRKIDADWVVLSGSAADHHPVIAGCVCFPSSWSLPEKLGKPIEEVHAPVPTVAEELNASIHTFLQRLTPKVDWERDNWGLAADDRLNHHPSVKAPLLHENARLETTWLRLERQLLIRLPTTNAILFGIKTSVHRLDELTLQPGLAPRIARALQTMPERIAAYKGLSHCREALARQLQSIATAGGS